MLRVFQPINNVIMLLLLVLKIKICQGKTIAKLSLKYFNEILIDNYFRG